MSIPTETLAAQGVNIWLDDLSRDRITTGNLNDLIRTRNVTGVTTNPTIFAAAIDGSTAYSQQIAEYAARGATADDRAHHRRRPRRVHVCRPVYDAAADVDGRVSIEVSPTLAHDTEGSITQAKELYARVDRPNVLIKIPAAKAGLPAITEVIAAGISVNVSLIFSVDRYADVIDAYLAGLERARANGLQSPTSTRLTRSSSPA